MPASSPDHAQEIVVVGAGIVGCAIAFELARRGASVRLADTRGVGLGATQASAGMLAPYIEGFRHGPLLDLMVRSLGLYDRFVERVSTDSGMGIGYARTGSLEVAADEESAAQLRLFASSLAASGVRCSLLDETAAREAEPQIAPDVVAGLHVPDHGFVVAGELTVALSAAAAKHGARICVPSRVQRLTQRGDAIIVELDGERVEARTVVLAAGCWSGASGIDGVPGLPVRPVRGQLLQLAWPGAPLARVTWGSRCYLVPWRNGSLLVGATVEEAGFDERATVAGVRDLLDAACDLVPNAWRAGFAGARVGLRPATPDELPVVGRSLQLPGLVYATGHYRNGVLLAPLTAQLVADLVLDGRADPMLEGIAPQRFGDC